MKFKLNGKQTEYSGDPNLDLMTYLREEAGILSPKNGCAPQAACGCCVVQVEDKGVLSCVTKMSKLDGMAVTTVEGLGDYRQSVFANSFVACGGVQCGFCIPGIVMQANALIDKAPDPSRAEIEKALQPNLCRCTGYKKIVDSVQMAADAIRNDEVVDLPSTSGEVGTRMPKYEAAKLVLGQHDYVDDIRIDGMKHAAIKFSDHPRARVLGIGVDSAEKIPGVIRILTADDYPGDRFIGLIKQDWPQMIAIGEITKFVGSAIALVVAETEKIAREAVDEIVIDYEVLEPIDDMHKALLPGSATVHGDTNMLSQSITNRGNWEASKSEAAYTAQGVFQTQMIEHGFMEPECAIAYPVGDGVEVLSQGQGVYDDRKQICKLLALPEDKVRVIMVPNGGGFGGKEDLSVQGHAALAAHLTGHPVKVLLNRHESIAFHPKRHPIWMNYDIGCDADGLLTYCKVKFIGDTGAHASVGMKVLERSAGHATGAYNFPVTDVVATAVYTNNLPCGAMRGFGVNQATFGLESLIDKLCEQGGFDRWQFRYDNALLDGHMTATGQVIEGGAGTRATLLAVKDQFDKAKYAGIACGIKNTGIGNGMPDESSAKITVVSADQIIIDHGWTEMGQGVNTIAIQVVCSETGLSPDLMDVVIDTKAEQLAGMTTASRATSLIGNALIDACKGFKADLAQHDLGDLAGRSYEGRFSVDWTTKPGAMVEKVYTHYSYSYATQLVILDEETGKVAKIVAAHDAGKIFNPTLFEGQLEGSIHMGLGYAISEGMFMENGRPTSTMLRKMGILRAKEMPEMEIIGVEVPDPHGPYGAKGVGEIGLVPTAGAVANALYQYDGNRRTELPMRIPRRGLKKRTS